jgi:UDP-glucose 4-epimerase
MVIPRFIGQALRGEPITVYGNGTQRRCFCDVADAVRAIIGLGEHPDAPGRLFNIGGRDEVTIRDLAERVKDIVESKSEIHCIPYSQAYAPGFDDMERRVPCTERIHDLLGWSPEISLDQLLHRTRDYIVAQEAGQTGR